MNHTLSTTSLVTISFNGLLGIIALYVSASLVYFEISSFQTTTSSTSNKTTRFLRSVCLVAVVCAVVHHFGVIAGYFVEEEISTCYAFGILWLGSYALGLLATYVFLWTRQHTINSSSALAYLRRNSILVLSWITLVVLILGTIMIFLAGSRLIFFSNCSDHADHIKLKLYTIILSGILLTLTIVGQAQLMALFIIPLVQHHRQTTKHFKTSRRVSAVSAGGNRSNRNLLIVKRCVAATIVCVCTDIVAAIITISVQHPIARLIYDFNLLINAVSCILSFRNWKQMLFPYKSMRGERGVGSSTENELQTEEVSTRI